MKSTVLAVSRRSGFTLIEVLVSLVILSTGIVLVLRALDTSLMALSDARAEMDAAEALRAKLAELTAPGQSGTDLTSSAGRFSVNGFSGDVRMRTLRTESGVTADGASWKETLHQVDVIIWRPPVDHRYTMSTYMRTSE